VEHFPLQRHQVAPRQQADFSCTLRGALTRTPRRRLPYRDLPYHDWHEPSDASGDRPQAFFHPIRAIGIESVTTSNLFSRKAKKPTCIWSKPPCPLTALSPPDSLLYVTPSWLPPTSPKPAP